MHAVGRGRRGVVAVTVALITACTPDAAEDPPAPPRTDTDIVQPDPDPDPEPEPPSETAPDAEPEPDPPDPDPALGAYGVSAGHEDAVAAGMAVLEDGGTAVDAAIAAAFAVSVVEPFASGIGGGGAALVVERDGNASAYDYREVVAQDGVIPPSGTGVPGFVFGMSALHDDHGALPWGRLVEPAITLAEDGVTTSGIVADQLRSAAHRLPTDDLPEFYPAGQPLDAGELLRQPQLAETLTQIAGGGDALREGATATALADQVDGIDLDSLAAYEVQRNDPARGGFAGFEVLGAAPPLPGAAVIQLLQVAEALDIGEAPLGSADHIHRLGMAWRVADASISSVLGDPDFVEVPVGELTNPEANAQIAADIPDDALLTFGAGAAQILAAGDAGNTTHITVVDPDGTLVSMTNTITNFWGSGQQVGGFFMNDQLRRFDIGDGANTPEAGRRSVSWSSPLVVLDGESRPVLGIGSPGGRRIPMIEASVLVRWALHGASLTDAVEAERFHLEGDVLEFERLPDDEVAADLRARGYTELDVPDLVYYFGSVQALEIDHDAGTVRGAVDPRREGAWDAGEP